jgi:hypothetical protein
MSRRNIYPDREKDAEDNKKWAERDHPKPQPVTHPWKNGWSIKQKHKLKYYQEIE